MIKTIRVILTFLILLSIAYPSSAQTQPWKKLQSPVNVTLRYLCFIDSLTGWAAGEAGTIIRTTDGGNNWEIQNSTVQTFIMDIFFLDEYNGWALTLKDVFPFNSVILKTTDGGNSWSSEDFQDMDALMRTIFYFDSLNGFMGGSYIIYTSDGGNSWIEANVDSNSVSNYPVIKFEFHSRQFGYACGGVTDFGGVVWRTADYGLNWSAQGISADEVFDIFIFDSLNAITLSGDPEGLFPIADLKTKDAGINWEYKELPFYGLSFNIDFRTHNEGWSASGYKFLLTTDRGETWGEFETPDSAVVYDLQFTDARTGYAVGENGTILKLDPNLVELEEEVFPSINFVLYQNYPNPFNPSTKIKYEIPLSPPLLKGESEAGGFVTLKVYDVLGNKVATLINEEKPVGAYEVEFNASGLSSGIYFYQIRASDFVQTKKMIYLK